MVVRPFFVRRFLSLGGFAQGGGPTADARLLRQQQAGGIEILRVLGALFLRTIQARNVFSRKSESPAFAGRPWFCGQSDL